ncbi:OadG family protein [Pseudoalteromonas mariniglutinosa]|uniref:OadG family protein n=1 Tax=Pseudoalteromonas mariniglutinosa TaxID=206042 RepID=UPI00384C0317
MGIAELLTTAASLMLTGMIGVFLFLSLLISAIKLMSKFAQHFDAGTIIEHQRSVKLHTPEVPAAHIAAISAAISQFKHKKK